MQPTKITRKPSFRVAGVSCRNTMTNNHIPQLWNRFNQDVCSKLPDACRADAAIGVCFYKEMEAMGPDAEFIYLAGMPIALDAPLPQGLEDRVVPEAEYAVFEHLGSLETLQDTYTAIYDEWLPNSGYQRANTDDFELYDARFKYGLPDSVMEIWVPVTKI